MTCSSGEPNWLVRDSEDFVGDAGDVPSFCGLDGRGILIGLLGLLNIDTAESLSIRLWPGRVGLLIGLFSFLRLSFRVKLLLVMYWLSGRFALGRSTMGRLFGSYVSLFSRAKMLLVLTRPACFSFSMLARRLGDSRSDDCSRSGVFSVSSKREDDIESRVLQNARGDDAFSLVKELSV